MDPHKLLCTSLSDIGYTRKNNEDLFLEMPEHSFFALADGMGGHNAGEIAAKEAILYLCQAIQKIPLSSPNPLLFFLSQIQKAVCDANSWVHHLSREKEEYEGMGTTLSCFLVIQNSLLFAHVGDSRLYRFRKELLQITEDHSLWASLLKKGELSPEEAPFFAHKNVLTRAIGPFKEVLPDAGILPIEKDDIYFLCSDGLTNHLCDGEIEEILQGFSSLEERAHQLMQSALKKGGRDNITLVLVKVL